jgi:hypothetical protein
MSMQALNQLVARSIIDPGVVEAFSAGRIADVLGELSFSPEMKSRLSGLKANSFTEFAILAYRTVKALADAAPKMELPSPLEGLLPPSHTGREQVA